MAIIDQLSSWLAVIVRFFYLENAIKLHEQVDKFGALISETDSAISRLLKPVMEPFMAAQKLLEVEKYVTVSLLVPYIGDLRDRLNHASDYLKLPAPVDKPVEIAAKKAVIPCVEALIEDFDVLPIYRLCKLARDKLA